MQPGSMPSGLALHLPGGPRHPAHPPRPPRRARRRCAGARPRQRPDAGAPACRPQAQLAANRVGATRSPRLFDAPRARRSCARVRRRLDYSERRTRGRARRAAGRRLPADTEVEGDGLTPTTSRSAARPTIVGDRIHFDFTGTATAVAGNVNCPLAVTLLGVPVRAARPPAATTCPTNAGIARAIELTAPEGSLVNASYPSAVVAGNVETSQRIADVLLAALGQASTSRRRPGDDEQLIIGGADWTYYETIGGGQGASLRRRGLGCPRRHEQHAEHARSRRSSSSSRSRSSATSCATARAGAARTPAVTARAVDPAARARDAVAPRRPARARARRTLRAARPGALGGNLVDGEELPAKVTLELDRRPGRDGADTRRRRLGASGRRWQRNPPDRAREAGRRLRLARGGDDACRGAAQRRTTEHAVARERRAPRPDHPGRSAAGDAATRAFAREALGVSRNTVREALRLLGHEGLVDYHIHRGVSVRRLSAEDVHDLYRTREALEFIAIDYGADRAARGARGDLRDRLKRRGGGVGGGLEGSCHADIVFHQRIVQLIGSEHVETFFRRIVAELRLGFAAIEPRSRSLRLVEPGPRRPAPSG